MYLRTYVDKGLSRYVCPGMTLLDLRHCQVIVTRMNDEIRIKDLREEIISLSPEESLCRLRSRPRPFTILFGHYTTIRSLLPSTVSYQPP